MPEVSIIIPVHNAEKYLNECLTSLENQTAGDIEIICADDNSSDGSAELLRAAAAEDKRIKVLRVAGGDAGAARNAGLDAAAGKFIAFCDADDCYRPDMTEKMLNCIGEADIAVCGFTYRKRNSYRNYCFPPAPAALPRPLGAADVAKIGFAPFKAVCWNKIFRRDFLVRHNLRFQSLPRSNDLSFVFTALAAAKGTALIPEPLYVYRIGDSTSLQGSVDAAPSAFAESLRELRRQLEKRGLFRQFEAAFTDAALRVCVNNLRSLHNPENFAMLYRALKNGLFGEFGISGGNPPPRGGRAYRAVHRYITLLDAPEPLRMIFKLFRRR